MIENVAIDRYLPGDIVWNILVHVPTKSLMRFKLVSKLWYSIIRNVDFAKNHAVSDGCFRGLVIMDYNFSSDYPKLYQSRAPNRIFYADLNANNVDDCDTLEYYEHVTWDLRDFNHVTSIVKGLIGLYNDYCFTLCNISTQEMVKLPRNSRFNNYEYSYHLGFDPVKEVYKVLKLSSDYSTRSSYTQIFTVGRDSDLTWRRIDDAPYNGYNLSLCINGTLYWLSSDFNYDDVLVAFHLNSESFETIPLPETLYFPKLAEIEGSPAIICLDNSDIYDSHDIDIWMMEKDLRGGFESWMVKKYVLPVGRLVYCGTLPTGEMLITRSVVGCPMPIFKYDHINNEMKLTKLYGPSGYQKHGVGNLASLQICYHEENILPLAPLLIKQPELTVKGNSTRYG